MAGRYPSSSFHVHTIPQKYLKPCPQRTILTIPRRQTHPSHLSETTPNSWRERDGRKKAGPQKEKVEEEKQHQSSQVGLGAPGPWASGGRATVPDLSEQQATTMHHDCDGPGFTPTKGVHT